MRPEERLEELEAALEHLRHTASGNGVVVEGLRDVAALEALGVGGTHWKVNVRGTVEDLVDSLVAAMEDEGWRAVVILTDWDRTGGRLARRLHDSLVGRVAVNLDARKRLSSACHTSCVEHIPAELRGLRVQAGLHR